jgi:hypothetical protein
MTHRLMLMQLIQYSKHFDFKCLTYLRLKATQTKNKLVKPWGTANHSFETAALHCIDYKIMLVIALGNTDTHFVAVELG